MTTDPRQVTVGGQKVTIVRKAIKNLHLGVYPPEGRVRVAAPLALSEEAVRVAIVQKLGWIRRQQASFQRQDRQSARDMVSGETHYFLGRRYRLDVVHAREKGTVTLRAGVMTLHVQPDWSHDRREEALYGWYRERLRELAEPLVAKWSKRLGVKTTFWGLKKMKTKWGSCNPAARRVWLNVELIKKPPECLEYLVVHELAHLVERHHNERFVALLDRHLPSWKATRKRLSSQPLAHETWRY